MQVIHLTKAEFLKKVNDFESHPGELKYEGDKPCIVDFYTDWCSYCIALSPLLDEIAKEYDGKIYVYKVDVDQEEALESEYRIRTIPTVLFIPMQGEPVRRQGGIGKAELKKIIDEKLIG